MNSFSTMVSFSARRLGTVSSLGVTIISLFLASGSWACEGPSGRSSAAASWDVYEVADDHQVKGLDDMVGEPYFYAVARSPLYPDLEVPLPAYYSAAGEIYDWTTVARYDHKIALLQYSGGAAGTSTTVEFINNVVVDLVSMKALGAANYMVTNQANFCVYSTWDWSDTGVRVEDEGISATIEFTFDLGTSKPTRFLDD